MSRSLVLLLLLPFAFGIADVSAQAAKKPAAPVVPAKPPAPKDDSVGITVFMRDNAKNELLVATKVWPDHPEYNAQALQRFFALMKMMGPEYKQDDNVAYTWGQKGKVAKCSIYLESFEAGAKGGTGTVVGCEANGVSSVGVPSAADPKHPISGSADPKHLADIVDLFKKSFDRAKANVPK